MRVAGYVCDYCPDGHDIPEDDIRDEYLCPTCGHKMWYISSCEIDDETGLTIGESWQDERRIGNDNIDIKPTISCPYCQSTNTKKISGTSKAVHTALFGIFSLSRNSKQWHCNNCKSDF